MQLVTDTFSTRIYSDKFNGIYVKERIPMIHRLIVVKLPKQEDETTIEENYLMLYRLQNL